MEDRGGEQRRKIEKNRKFGNQKVSKVVGKKKSCVADVATSFDTCQALS